MKLGKLLQTKLPDWVRWPFDLLHGLILLIVISELIHMLFLHGFSSK
tara:strand:- start:324 stop:464 length:141 start_codon:yes stop_codon:yes gene_type:complete